MLLFSDVTEAPASQAAVMDVSNYSLTCLNSVAIGTDDDDEASTERNMAAVTPIPKIVTTPIKEDLSREEEDDRDEWGERQHGRD